MTPRDTLQRIQRHAGVYRRLTRWFPAEFRSEYEEPMLQLFRDHCREAMESDRTLDWLALWSRTLADAGVSLIREHAAALRRRFQTRGRKVPSAAALMTASKSSRRISWYWIPLLAAVGGVVAGVISAAMPNRYRSTSALVSVSTLTLSPTANQESPTSTDSILALMTQETVIQRTLGKLQEGRNNTNKLRRPMLSARSGPGGTFVMEATSNDYDYSRLFVSAWAQEFVDFEKQQQRNQIGNSEAVTTSLILRFQRNWEMAQQALDDFRKKNKNDPVVGNDSEGVQETVKALRATLVGLNQELLRLESAPRPAAGTVGVGNPAFDLKFEIRRLENRLAVHPGDPGLKVELDLKKADLASYSDLVEEDRKARVAEVRQLVNAVQRQVAEKQGEVLEANGLIVEERRLREEERRYRQQLDELNTQLVQIGRFGVDVERFQLLSVGMGSPIPIGPNRPLNIALGVGCGGLAGMIVMILLMCARWIRSTPAAPGLAPG